MWHIYSPQRGDLDGYLNAAREGASQEQNFQNEQMSYLAPAAVQAELSGSSIESAGGGMIKLTADEQGQFELAGVGRERVVRLFVEGPNIESAHFVVVTRPEIDEKWQRKELSRNAQLDLDSGASLPIVHTATFVYAAGPSRPIRGVVRDHETKEPLAGVLVSGDIRNRPVHANATTDENGRYELRGLAAEGMLRMYATPQGTPYLGIERQWQRIAATEPLQEQDFELGRGVTVRGAVLNANTGAAVKARVSYLGVGINPHVQQMPDQLAPYNNAITQADGSYELTVLPGPGILAVYAFSKAFKPATAADFIIVSPREVDGNISTVNMGLISPDHYHAARDIAPEPASEPLTIDFALEPSGPLDGLFGGALGELKTAVEKAAGDVTGRMDQR
jgi:hypothetical protein